MPKQRVVHTSPNSSTCHLTLRRAVERARLDPEQLRNLLWLMNAHDQLIAFPRICRNIVDLLSLIEQHWQVSAAEFHLTGSVPIMRWIIEYANELSNNLGSDFNRQAKQERDHPVMSRGSSRHPLYTTLWNTCESPHLQNKFYLLQGHLLFAHARQVFYGNDRDGYENYIGQHEWRGIANSPYSACLAVRDLSELQNADVLSSLAVELEPVEFARSLNILPPVENAQLLNRLESLRTFLQKSAGLKNWVHRSATGGQGSGGSKRITGYVEISKQLHQLDVTAGDTNDPDDDWGTQSLVAETQPDHEEQCALLTSDLSPDEFDTEELLLTGYDNDTNPLGNLAATGPAQLRHIVMTNQLLPWTYNQLSISELGFALSRCSAWIRENFTNNQTPKAQDIEKLEAISLMHVMLFTGSNFERARNLLALPAEKINEDTVLAIVLDPDKTFHWRVRAIQPEYKISRSVADGSERKRVDYFSLPDVAQTGIFINLLLDHHQDNRSQETTQNTSRTFRVFRRRSDTLRHNLKALLKELDPTGRLTEAKLNRFMFNRLLQESNGDICAASMLAGEEHPLARVRLFYSVVPVKELQQKYIDTTSELVGLLYAAAGKQHGSAQPPAIDDGARHVGSRLCPTLDTVKHAIAKLKQAIQISAKSDDIIDHHNLYTLFTIWHFTFSTACRAIETPYLPLPEIDIATGVGLLSDKDDGTGYKSRLIWIPPTALAQMQLYEMYQCDLISQFPDLAVKGNPSVFFLEHGRGDRLQPAMVRPKSMQPVMEKFLSYPANFHRRFMRTELLARGCASEVVDALMGHWHMGEEPWALHSSFSFQAHRNELEKHLAPLLDEIGLNGHVESLVSISPVSEQKP